MKSNSKKTFRTTFPGDQIHIDIDQGHAMCVSVCMHTHPYLSEHVK